MARSEARRFLHILLAAVAAAPWAACGSRASPGAALADDWDRPLDRGAAARRIVSLAPATTELVFALGLGDRLVGRTTWCDWPPEVRDLADVGAGIGINVEAVAARRPDLALVYASESNRDAVSRLEALGIRVAVLRVDLAGDLRRASRLIATLAGRPEAAESLVAAFDSAMASVRRPAAGSPSLYVDVQASPPLTVGAGSYLNEILEAAGARNLFDDVPQSSAPVSLETIAVRDPDAILVITSDTARPPAVARRAGWRAVRAVREGRIVVVPGTLYDRPSPRMPLAVADLAARLAALQPR